MSAATGGGGGGGAGVGAPEEDKKPMDQSAHINLKVKGQVCMQGRKLYAFYLCLHVV